MGRYGLRSNYAIPVAVGVMNVTSYAYTILAARFLGPRDFGAFASVMNLLMVVNVVALALQANAARRIAAEPGDVHAIEAAIGRVGRRAAFGLAGLCLLAAPLINWVLRLDSLATAVLVGVTTIPLTLLGYQAGVLQGERRWGALGVVYAAVGIPRLVIGCILLLGVGDTFSAVLGVMIAAWVPVAVAAVALRSRTSADPGDADAEQTHTDRELWRETARNSHALLAYFALSNIDVVIARNVLDSHEAGLYAAGLIMTKAVLFLPQFVTILAFPSMGAQETRLRTLLQSLGAVFVMGLAVAAGVALLPDIAIVFVGGSEYAAIKDSLWAFAVLGMMLAMLQLLVYSVLARQARKSVYLLWGALVALVLAGRLAHDYVDLLLIVMAVDAVLLGVLLAVSLWRLGGSHPRTPVVQGAESAGPGPAVG